MSNFIDKVKAIVEKIKIAIDKFANTSIGNFVMKTCCMLLLLLMAGGVICTIITACICKVGFIPAVAIAIVCLCTIDEFITCIKCMIN